MNNDPRATIAAAPMSVMQIIAVAITVGLNGLDGFDVLSISFAGPGILKEWGLDRAALGFVLSMELWGMALGSLVLGPLADKIGRRPLTLGCLVMMAVGMFMATTVTNIYELSAWRVITGFGIGGLLAAINAIAAEFSNLKRRHLSVAIMAIGYPIGAVLGGLVVAELLKTHTWRSVFYFGAICTVVFIPLVLALVPESVQWLTRKQPAGAIERINRTLVRMGHAAISVLPTISDTVRKRSVADLFAPGLIATTLLVAIAYFFHVTTFYFVLKWTPNIVAGMGFEPSSAAKVLVWANVGGALGGATLGLLTLRFNVKMLTIAAMVISSIAVIIFGRTPPDLQKMSMYVAFSGFFTNGAIVGMYAIFAQAFPTHVRAGGTGFGIGVGRGGSALAPIIAGFLFKANQPLPVVASVMAMGSLLAAIVVSFIKLRADDGSTETVDEGGEQQASSLRGASATS